MVRALSSCSANVAALCDRVVLPSRRAVILGGAATIALPFPVHGQVLDRLDLLRLHPARFVAGLIFDIALAVLVALVSDSILSAIRQGAPVAPPTDAPKPPTNETDFRHANYKGAIVTLGLVDWREHRTRQIALRLRQSRPEDLKRFETIRDYLRRENIRIKLADQRVPHALPVQSNLELDDLFTLDYFRPDGDDQRETLKHYENLIRETGTTVFDKWFG